MIIKTINTVFFSPTGTTRKVVEGIASHLGDYVINSLDITRPTARENSVSFSDTDLLLVGVPVYMGRVPDIIHTWLSAIEAANTPVICIAVYGNRAYDNALRELQDIMVGCGCRPLAAAAFIGEHSFSCEALPTAQGRPDEDDLQLCFEFAEGVREKLSTLSSAEEISEVEVAGSYPYNGVTKLWDVDFIEITADCNYCGKCASLCPTGAIAAEAPASISIEKCITCCACIKSCPQNARTIKESPVQAAAQRLYTNCSQRRAPEFFL